MSFALNCWPLLNSTSDCCLVKLPTVWLQIRNAPLTLKTSFHLILLKLTKWSFLVCCEWLLRVYKKGLRTNLWTVWSEAAQSCPILCDPMDYSLPGSSIHGIFPGKNTGVGCHFLLQEIFPTQGLNLGLLCCRQTLYRPSHQGSSSVIILNK